MAGEEVTKIVIDASVAVKWFNPEELSSEALELRDMHVNAQVHIFAPDLLLYEVINAIKWNSEFNKNDVSKAAGSLEDLMITYKEILPVAAVDIAYNYNLTIYDSSYIALARKLDTILITADDKLRKAADQENCIIALDKYIN